MMHFVGQTYEEVDEYMMNQLVFGDDSIAIIVRGHLFIEKVLNALVSSHMKNADTFFNKNRSFTLLCELAFGLGLISEQQNSAYKALNGIRNDIAHKSDYEPDIEDLNSLKIGWTDSQKTAFNMACTKGWAEAARIALIFLGWDAIHHIKSPEEQ